MDYRDRNPNITFWRTNPDDILSASFPFNFPTKMLINHVSAPDNSTAFLALPGESTESEDFVVSTVHYLIESPLDCLMRRAFIFGEIDWQDYWHHKGWLIELHKENFLLEDAKVKYIRPNQIGHKTKSYLHKMNSSSPLQLRYEALAVAANVELNANQKRGQHHRELEMFIAEYSHLIVQRAA